MSILPKSGPGNLGLRFSAPAFLLGFLAASFQIFLLREFSAHFFGNELTFGLVLAAWLLWGGLGKPVGFEKAGDARSGRLSFRRWGLLRPDRFRAFAFFPFYPRDTARAK